MIKVLKSGFFTTIQDAGRFGFRNKGVPISGAMDGRALDKANFLLENESDAAVLEITMTGPTLLFEEPTYICLTGAELSATLNNEPIATYKVQKVRKGDILSYGRLEYGFRAYLAVKGGIQSQAVMGSRSHFYPITAQRCIQERQELPFVPTKSYDPKIPEIKIETYSGQKEILVYKGPEFDCLETPSLQRLFEEDFTIAKENNRMGYQIKEPLEACNFQMLTSATVPGTVQVTPSGKLIILMKDGQTTGGYPRVLQLTAEAIAILAQKKSGDTIKFLLQP